MSMEESRGHWRGRHGLPWDGEGDYGEYLRGKQLYERWQEPSDKAPRSYHTSLSDLDYGPEVLRSLLGIGLSLAMGVLMFCAAQWLASYYPEQAADLMTPWAVSAETWAGNTPDAAEIRYWILEDTVLLNPDHLYWEASYQDWIIFAFLCVWSAVPWLLSRKTVIPLVVFLLAPLSAWLVLGYDFSSAVRPEPVLMPLAIIGAYVGLVGYNRYALPKGPKPRSAFMLLLGNVALMLSFATGVVGIFGAIAITGTDGFARPLIFFAIMMVITALLRWMGLQWQRSAKNPAPPT